MGLYWITFLILDSNLVSLVVSSKQSSEIWSCHCNVAWTFLNNCFLGYHRQNRCRDFCWWWRQRVSRLQREVLERGVAAKREITFETELFRSKTFLIYVEPVFSKAGEAIGVNYMGMDVTDQVSLLLLILMIFHLTFDPTEFVCVHFTHHLALLRLFVDTFCTNRSIVFKIIWTDLKPRNLGKFWITSL